MWASCCSWLCMDAPDVEEAEQRHQSYTNSAFSSQPSPPPEHTCTACGGNFDTPARKVNALCGHEACYNNPNELRRRCQVRPSRSLLLSISMCVSTARRTSAAGAPPSWSSAHASATPVSVSTATCWRGASS